MSGAAIRAVVRAALELDGVSAGIMSQIAALVKRYREHEVTKDDFVEKVCEVIEGKA